MSSRIDAAVGPRCTGRWRSGLLRACNTVTRLTVERDQLYATRNADEQTPVSVAAESRIGRRVTLLKIRTADARSQTHLVVLADLGPGFRNITPDDFRRLRMWLRLGHNDRPPASTT
ncbi:MAG: hypothetical protein ACQEV6_14555 [Pseudomonadota bacterium]